MLRKSAPLPFRTFNSAYNPSTEVQAESHHRNRENSPTPPIARNQSPATLPLRKPPILDGRWRIDSEVLGTGSWAEVRLGFDMKENVRVAVKIIDACKLTERDRELISREIRVMQTLQHPNIVRMYGHLEERGKIYIFLEYFGGGDLLTVAIREPRFVQMKARRFLQQILGGVEYLHRRGIVHRDLKLENVLLNETHTRVAITDFGLCGFISNEPLDMFCGSPAYAAPELVTRTPYKGEPVDMWAIGVILYTMVCGAYPFDADDIPSLYSRIVKSPPRITKNVPNKAISIIEGLLHKNPGQRWTIGQVREADWMRGSFVGALRTAARGLFAQESSSHHKTISM